MSGSSIAEGRLSRRRFLTSTATAVAVSGAWVHARPALATTAPARIRPVSLADVTLAPSIYRDSVEANRRYLMSLRPDRLLHNFRQQAGLQPKGAVYGGWESDTIAGHTLGHYLSALSKQYAQTHAGDCRRRVAYIVDELAHCQAQSDDGYVGGLTRRNAQGKIEDGRRMFEEVRRGVIHASKFDLNGSWSPLYTVHKLLAGLLDAQHHCDNGRALDVAVGVAGYIYRTFAPLDEAQTQQVLACEFGGLNESYADLYHRTNDRRWRLMARKLRHHAVIDPLESRRDDLPDLHANTQIPKIIGLAREYEVTGNEHVATAARFFWQRVTGHYSYAIGGNGDREYFQQPDTIADYLTEQTCEHCASYNMLKLTRHVYAWSGEAHHFDYYERTLLNHIMAQQHPDTGMYTYMTPTISGGKREYSTPTDSFWCCVGTGMERHAQFADSIFWHDAATLYVNLYIPARLDSDDPDMAIDLEAGLPEHGDIRLTLTRVGRHAPRRLALRIPVWAQAGWTLKINGMSRRPRVTQGYAVLDGGLKAGDVIEFTLPLNLRLEATTGDPDTVAVFRGPLLMAADLGASDHEFSGPSPALVASARPLDGFERRGPAHYRASTTRPEALTFVPFYAQYDRRSAIYFKRMDPVAWHRAESRRADHEARRTALNSRALDNLDFGDEASESEHGLTSDTSFSSTYRRESCRDVRATGFIEFRMKNVPGQPLLLRLRTWGGDDGRYQVRLNGKLAFHVSTAANDTIAFVEHDHPLPAAADKVIHLRIESKHGDTAGPFFAAWLLPQSGDDYHTA